MLAIAALDLRLLLERRNSGVFHEVHAHDGGPYVWIGPLTLHTTTDISPILQIYLESSSDWTTLLNIHIDIRVPWYAAARYLEPSVSP
jgi:hypothetical protein